MTKMMQHPAELRERAVAMACELKAEPGGGRGAIARTAKYLGLNPETVRNWVRAEERGKKPSGELASGSAAEKDARIRELEKDNAELRRANDILKAASAFFAQELNPRPPR
jgi:transposase